MTTGHDNRGIKELWEGVKAAPRKVRDSWRKTLDAREGFLSSSATPAKKARTVAPRFVAYYRVSTTKQGASGLGLEAQRADVLAYVARQGGEVMHSFEEIESGKVNARPQLDAALAFARRAKATLLVAKLDRLSRNVAFLAALMESGADFVAVDNPHANRFTIHILAAVAEHERELISSRTSKALAAKKAKGALLGSARPGHWKGREEARRRGARLGGKAAGEAHHAAALEAYRDIEPIIEQLHTAGKSQREIAAELTAQGFTTRRGKPWGHSQVSNLLHRMKGGKRQ